MKINFELLKCPIFDNSDSWSFRRYLKIILIMPVDCDGKLLSDLTFEWILFFHRIPNALYVMKLLKKNASWMTFVTEHLSAKTKLTRWQKVFFEEFIFALLRTHSGNGRHLKIIAIVPVDCELSLSEFGHFMRHEMTEIRLKFYSFGINFWVNSLFFTEFQVPCLS